jgi:hypothetical protein
MAVDIEPFERLKTRQESREALCEPCHANATKQQTVTEADSRG